MYQNVQSFLRKCCTQRVCQVNLVYGIPFVPTSPLSGQASITKMMSLNVTRHCPISEQADELQYIMLGKTCFLLRVCERSFHEIGATVVGDDAFHLGEAHRTTDSTENTPASFKRQLIQRHQFRFGVQFAKAQPNPAKPSRCNRHR